MGQADGEKDPSEYLRVSAYAVCVEDGRVLLARWVGWSHDSGGPRWTLPGGGLDHGEHPEAAAIREVREETGLDVEITSLLGVDSLRQYWEDSHTDFQGLRIIYAARVLGGELRPEIGGSTDLAAWVPLADVAELPRVRLVDIALRYAGATRADASAR